MNNFTFNQRRSRSGSFAPNDDTPKGKVEAREYREGEAEKINSNQARPFPATYRSLEQIQAEEREKERLENLRQAALYDARGNWRAAKVFREAAERLEVKG